MCKNFVTVLRFAIHLNSFIASIMVIIVIIIIITLVLVIITISLEFGEHQRSQRKPVTRINRLTCLLGVCASLLKR
jgi:nitric oxide reductase large subunit